MGDTLVDTADGMIRFDMLDKIAVAGEAAPDRPSHSTQQSEGTRPDASSTYGSQVQHRPPRRRADGQGGSCSAVPPNTVSSSPAATWKRCR